MTHNHPTICRHPQPCFRCAKLDRDVAEAIAYAEKVVAEEQAYQARAEQRILDLKRRSA